MLVHSVWLYGLMFITSPVGLFCSLFRVLEDKKEELRQYPYGTGCLFYRMCCLCFARLT